MWCSGDRCRRLTGWRYDFKELLTAGERIVSVRQLYYVMEGINPIDLAVPGRVPGRIDLEPMAAEFYPAMRWDLKTDQTSSERLKELGLVEFAQNSNHTKSS